jgi:hypothetical protein
LCAALQRLLRLEGGITDAVANPLTGRVLIRFYPEIPVEHIERLLLFALDRAPFEPAALVEPVAAGNDFTP